LRKYYFWKTKPRIGESQREGKVARVRKVCKTRMEENLTMLGLGFLKETVMAKKLRITINMCLGGLC